MSITGSPIGATANNNSSKTHKGILITDAVNDELPEPYKNDQKLTYLEIWEAVEVFAISGFIVSVKEDEGFYKVLCHKKQEDSSR